MNFLVRNASVQDAEKIAALSNQLGYAISVPATRQNIEAIGQNKNEAIFVAQAGDELAGWIHVFRTIRVESGTFGEIGGLIVNDRFRRNGAGKLLVENARQWCMQKAIPFLRVRCNNKRKEAHAFYAALGFSESKEQKVFETRLP